MDRRRLVVGVVIGALLIGAIGVGIYYYTTNAQARTQILEQLDIEPGPTSSGGLMASGFIEAEEVEVATELGGRVVELLVEEGDQVVAGDKLVQLDTSLFDAQRDIVEAQVAIIEAQRALLKAGPRKEIIAQAKAQVTIAQASLDAAQIIWSDAVAVSSNPQEIKIQLVDAQTQLRAAQEDLAAAHVQLKSAERAQELYWEAMDMIKELEEKYAWMGDSAPKFWVPFDVAMAPQHYEAAWINLNAAADAVEGATALVDALQQLADNPQGLWARAADTERAFKAAAASVERAQAELAVLEAGIRDEDIDVADAMVEEAQAALDILDAQIERLSIYAPIGGVILERSVHVGELAIPGAPLVTIANLDVVELTVYISTAQLDKVSLNQSVVVTVDSAPGRTFEGVVVHIADEAEFTPRSVQTREERVNLVYAIKIRIENPDYILKPGMPADALFE